MATSVEAQGLQVRIDGLDRLLKKASPEILVGPMRRFFERAAIAIQSRAREGAPVDTGRLRSSIAYEIDGERPPRYAKVGTNVQYAPFMEYGTGMFAEGPGAKGGRHWPPGDALGVWATRHGFENGWAAAAAIGRAGGLKPRRFLRNAVKENLAAIRGFVETLGREIHDAWEKR